MWLCVCGCRYCRGCQCVVIVVGVVMCVWLPLLSWVSVCCYSSGCGYVCVVAATVVGVSVLL